MNERLEARTVRLARPLMAAVLASLSVAGFPGCSRRRADAAPVAPPAPIPTSAPALNPPPGPLSEPQTRTELPPPQAVPEGAAPAPRGPFAYEAPDEPAEPAEPQPSESPVRTVASSPSAPAPAPSESSAPAEVPQLGPLISTQQRQVFLSEIDRNSDQARAALATLMGRRLTADQSEGVRRIREFLRQAAEARSSDVALARNLSERARLLAEDLVRNTR